MTPANRNLLVRIASAVVLAPPLVALILWREAWGFALLMHAAVAICLVELFWIVLRDDPLWRRLYGVALGVLVSATVYWCPRADALLALWLAATLLTTLLVLVRPGELATSAARMALLLFGAAYIGLLLTTLALLKRLPHGASWVILVLTITWFSDTGAYAVGRALGRHKLYPLISPGKSIEGAVGGLAAAVGAALLARAWYLPTLSLVDVLLIALPAGALAQIGDLVESMIKRAYQVKDSGWIIPGHGGLLDRFDALLFCAPYVYLYAQYVFGRGA